MGRGRTLRLAERIAARPSVVTPPVPLHMCKAVGPTKQAGHQEASSAHDILSVQKQICDKSSIQVPAVCQKLPD